MSDKTVRELAEVVGIPLERLLEQMAEAGLKVNAPDAIVDEEEKTKLLVHLRKRHGKSEDIAGAATPTRVTLKRRKVSELKQAAVPGSSTKTISVEVRKKKTYIKRTEVTEAVELKEKTLESLISADVAQSFKASEVLETIVQQVAGAEVESFVAEQREALVEEKLPQAVKTAEQLLAEQALLLETQKKEAEQKERERKQRLEESVQRNADKVRKQAEAKQQLQNKKKQPARTNSAQTGRSSATATTNQTTATAGKTTPSNNRNTANTTGTAAGKNTATKSTPTREGSAGKGAANGREVPAGRGVSAGKAASTGRGGAMSVLDEYTERETGSRRVRGKKPKQKSRGASTVSDAKHQFEMPVAPSVKEVTVPEHIIVSDLAQKMSVKAAEVIKHLMKLGLMATINQSIDQETAVILVEEMGHKAIMQSDDDVEQEMLAAVENTVDEREVFSRAPIVTIMGHVDHGKTSLLDYIRKTRVAAGEAGGITQHIGAYQVKTDHGAVTFLDTPGHAAFTAMRARGAEITDVVIVVVAADDGVMPQTKEAVEHARAANVPIIVAINKIDKPSANPEKVMQELATINVLSEEWGGDVQFLKISAKTGEGIDELIEALILQSEILELTAPVEGNASGLVIESRLDKGRGAVATVLVQRGTLNKGEFVLCGHEYGRVRAMFNETGKAIKTAGPCTPVEILGLSGTPNAGDRFLVVQNERVARELAEHREDKSKSTRHAAQQASKLEEVFSKMAAGETATLNLVIKTDVQGSLEALRGALTALSTPEVEVKCVYGGVGGINETDANLALASGAILMGFNVRADATSRKLIEEKDIDLHYYSVIYEAIDEVKRSINGMLAPDIHEKIVGLAEVRDVFRSPKFGLIAGCMVVDGFVKRNLPIRVLRDNVVIFEGQLESLRRFKDDASEVKMGMECGIGVKNYNDVKIGDQIEVFERFEVKREV
jgi:translation initiation factor IF-2